MEQETSLNSSSTALAVNFDKNFVDAALCRNFISIWGQVHFDVNIGRAARDGCNATWNLDGNTAF
jgi:hypothetical protein